MEVSVAPATFDVAVAPLTRRGPGWPAILTLAMLVVVLAGCGIGGADCRDPLEHAQCEAAVADARAFVEANPRLFEDIVAGGDIGAISYTMVWTCGTQDVSCHRDQPGLGWVRMVDAAGRSPGRIVVCVQESVCGDRPTLLAFP
jgi:hypothetical protein